MFDRLPSSWKAVLKDEINKPYLNDLQDFIKSELQKGVKIYPNQEEIFNAFKHCDFKDVKVVILGQDPYHGPGQAHGLAFSVKSDVKVPPSLKNIYKELGSDFPGFQATQNGNLSSWATQGVLLLNATLSVRAHAAASHQGKGWEQFTDKVIETLSSQRENLVFILWGNYAKQKSALIDPSKHFIIQSAHPSPLSAYQGFFGSQAFSKTNQFLTQKGLSPINWSSVCLDSQQTLF